MISLYELQLPGPWVEEGAPCGGDGHIVTISGSHSVALVRRALAQH